MKDVKRKGAPFALSDFPLVLPLSPSISWAGVQEQEEIFPFPQVGTEDRTFLVRKASFLLRGRPFGAGERKMTILINSPKIYLTVPFCVVSLKGTINGWMRMFFSRTAQVAGSRFMDGETDLGSYPGGNGRSVTRGEWLSPKNPPHIAFHFFASRFLLFWLAVGQRSQAPLDFHPNSIKRQD